ncbi:MAG: hypothetical protein OQJ87_03680 [Rhodospirillales bacterium]|nr:hypothetical protein [Rhodospirillales bacterium]MCW8952060.1 hypothetical protein [Rhodospirillales bacterium]MCW9001797.1 hypothetical protein [Rhodospirillales bacterium]MCW9040251.1 hypothetical protein [Rhodospirillales bacterium]
MDVTSMTALMVVRSAAVETREANTALIKEALEKAKEPNPDEKELSVRSVEDSSNAAAEEKGTAVDVSV